VPRNQYKPHQPDRPFAKRPGIRLAGLNEQRTVALKANPASATARKALTEPGEP
jgi:hypothetical protein